MTRFSMLILFLLYLLPGQSQTRIQGSCKGAEGRVIRIIAYDDFVSGREITLAHDVVKEDGHFALEMDLEKTRYALLDLEFVNGEIYIEPGNEYELEVYFKPMMESDLYFDRVVLDFDFSRPDPLNSAIRKVNRVYNDFILDYFEDIYRNKRKYLVDTLDNRLTKLIAGYSNPYVTDYVRYKIAALEEAARAMGRESLAREYLSGKPVLYDNIEYFYFFSQFFEKYLVSNTGDVNYHNVHDIFLDKGTLADLVKLIRKDPLLRDERLAEYFLLQNMMSLLTNPDFPNEQVVGMLEELQAGSKYAEHRMIAGNLLLQYFRLKPGTAAPAFSLSDVEGSSLTLEQFKGKVVYLYFFLSNNPSCTYEQDKMLEMKGSLPEDIVFLGISADRDPAIFQSLARSGKYPWTLLYYGRDLDLLEQYDAVTYPLFLVIDKEGNIGSYPAPRPSEDPRNILFSLSRK